jgi:hypothetical protein
MRSIRAAAVVIPLVLAVFALLVVAGGARAWPILGSQFVGTPPPTVTNSTAFPEPVPPVAQAHCQASDHPETGLQGEVPMADRLDGRAALGYNCNLTQLANFGSTAADPTQSNLAGGAPLVSYGRCLYEAVGTGVGPQTYGDQTDKPVVILDMSNPSHPVPVGSLDLPAPGEAMKVSPTRGLLISTDYATDTVEIYSLVADCAHPRLLFHGSVPGVYGHESVFSPDGNVYYSTAGFATDPSVAIDVSDPSRPRVLTTFAPDLHGGSSNPSGTRLYMCQTVGQSPGVNSAPASNLLIYDTSHVMQGRMSLISTTTLFDTRWCQRTTPVSYNGHPYLLQWGEDGLNGADPLGGAACTDSTLSPFSYPHIIDIANERQPRVVSYLIDQIGEPSNCARASILDRSFTVNHSPVVNIFYSVFVYGVHMCTPDRLNNPTILACSGFESGLRVYDIRDPLHPTELAYYNPGTLSPTDPTVDFQASYVVLRPDLGEIWYDGFFTGLHVLKFEANTYQSTPLNAVDDGDY